MSVSTRLDAVVDPDWIAARLDDPSLRIVEIDVTRAAYDAGHIAGAVFWNAYGDLRPVEYRPLPASELAGLLSRTGIGPDSVVVVYGYAAYLGYWLLRSYGHEAVHVLDGPRERWLESGHGWAWTTDAASRASSSYPASAACAEVVSCDDVLEVIGDPDVVLLDVRSREEFTGERFWPSGGMQEGGRAGHIPGAVWLPVDVMASGPEEVGEACVEAGVLPERHVVVYCTIGNRASRAWYVLRHRLGYPRVSVYYGSWAEWGVARDTPVEC